MEQGDIIRGEIVDMGGEVERVVLEFGQDAFGFAINGGGVSPVLEDGAEGAGFVGDGIAIGISGNKLVDGVHVRAAGRDGGGGLLRGAGLHNGRGVDPARRGWLRAGAGLRVRGPWSRR